MATLTPNFNFDGKCEEAIHLYVKAFNAKVNTLLRYSDAKWEDFHRELTEEQKNFVYHARLYIQFIVQPIVHAA